MVLPCYVRGMRSMQVALGALVASPQNANVMSAEKYAALVESIRVVGFVVPLLIKPLEEGSNKYLIVDGHHRTKAAHELGLVDVPAVVLEGDEDPRIVALAVNRLRGETDLAVASLIIAELVDDGLEPIDLTITGFSQKEIDELLAATHSPDEVELEDLEGAEVPAEVGSPVARPYLLDLTFRSKEDLASARKALRKAAGKGGDLADGLLRLVRGES